MKILDGWRYILVYKDEFLARVTKRPDRANLDIPHFPQIEKEWRETGAQSPEEYDFWKWNVCGMACLKMILKHWTGRDNKIIELAKKCGEYRGYFPEQAKEVGDKSVIPGLFYKAFAKFVKVEFGLKVLPTSRLSLTRMKYELARGNIIMVSIKSEAGQRHLVVLTGYDESRNTITVNDPALEKGGRELLENEFKDAYNGRGYVFFAPKSKNNG